MQVDLSAQPEIQGSARFSREGSLRNEIRRWWVEPPTRWAAWLMLNPSTAAEDCNDRTTLRVTRFSRAFGCQGWIGVNLHPFVASKTPPMWRWANWRARGPAWDVRDDLESNLADIERVARLSTLRIVAFGAEAVARDEEWLGRCLDAFGQPADGADADARFYCLGVNDTGQPLHPLARGRRYVPDSQRPILWSRK